MRIIYADILFVLNVYITYGLLLLTALISKTSMKRLRLLFASLLSGLYSLIILVPEISDSAVSLSRVPFCFLLIFVSCRVLNKRHLFRLVVSFFGVNFAFGGLMFALWYFFTPENLYYNGGIVYFDIDATTLVVLTAVCWVLLRAICKALSFKTPHNTVYDLHIYYKDKEFLCKSFLDTGNSLSDPFTAYPVVIVHKGVFEGIFSENIFDEKTALENKLRFIVCSTVGGEGLLPCFRPSRVKISSLDGSFETDRVVVALTEKKLRNGDFEAILPPDLFVNQKSERGDSYAKKNF